MLLAICAICLVALAFPGLLGAVFSIGFLGVLFLVLPWYWAIGLGVVIVLAVWAGVVEGNKEAKAKAQKEEEDKLLREYQLKLAREALGQ